MTKTGRGLSCFFISAIILLGIMSGAAGAYANADTPPRLLFEDNFDGDTLDNGKWERCPEQTRCSGMDYWDNALSYLDGNGLLILGAEWNAEENRVHSGAIHTNNKFHAGYGYYEASIRFPSSYGIWGAFWIMAGSVTNENGGSEDGIEIDIVESIDNERGRYNHALHWNGYGERKQTDSAFHTKPDIYDGNFHKFALWRTEEYYIFYVDGAEMWRSKGGGICPLDGYMILSMESAESMGGGTKESINALPAKMETDYVRVWETNPYIASPSAQPDDMITVKANSEKSGGKVYIDVTVEGKRENVTVICAVYNGDGKLAGAQLKENVGSTNEKAPIRFEFDADGAETVSALVCKNISGTYSLLKSVNADLNGQTR